MSERFGKFERLQRKLTFQRIAQEGLQEPRPLGLLRGEARLQRIAHGRQFTDLGDNATLLRERIRGWFNHGMGPNEGARGKGLRGMGGLGAGSVCLDHITDEFLKDALHNDVAESSCSFCDRQTSPDGKPFAVPIDDLVNAVTAAIRRHYGSADDEGAPWDNEDGYMVPTYDVSEVVGDICGGAFDEDFEESLCDAVVQAIGWDVLWVEGGQLDRDFLDWGWDQFTTTVRSTSRFVIAPPTFDELDDDLGQTRPGRERRNDPPHQLGDFLRLLLTYVDGSGGFVVELPVGTAFHRGRLMAEPDSLKPTVENLRPAPSDKASANRMSPAGISMFYAAAEPETAIAEIASHGPEPYAMTGTFRNTRPLLVLDLTVPAKRPSVFDAKRHTELRMVQFRNSFVGAITAPIISGRPPAHRVHTDSSHYRILTLGAGEGYRRDRVAQRTEHQWREDIRTVLRRERLR